MTQTRLKTAGLLQETQTESKSYIYTDQPTENLEYERLLDGRSDCYRLPAQVQVLKNKRIIITDPLFRFGLVDYKSTIKPWYLLFQRGFEIYAWTGALTPITNVDDIASILMKIQPIPHMELKRLLAENGMTSDECYLAGIEQTNLLNILFLNTLEQLKAEDLLLKVEDLLNIPQKDLIQLLISILDTPSITLKFKETNLVSHPILRDYLAHSHLGINLTSTKNTWINVAELIKTCENNLEKLNLVACHKLGVLPSGFYLPKSLKNLNLTNTYPTKEDLRQLIRFCINLETLNLTSCPNLGTLSDGILLPSSLKYLNLSSITCNLDNITRLVKPCLSLETLNLTSSKLLGDHIRPDSYFPASLNHLNLSYTSYTFYHLAQLIRFCHHLKILTLKHCKELGDIPDGFCLPASLIELDLTRTMLSWEYTAKLIQHCTNLESLNLSSCRYYDLKNLPNTSALSTSLKILNLSCVDLIWDAIGNLIKPCSNLETLNLNGCNSLGKMPNRLVLPTSINELSLSNTQSTWNDIAQLTQPCPNLETLNLTACKLLLAIPNEIVLSTSLKNLKLNHNFQLNWHDLIHLNTAFPNLETLDLSGCNSLGDIPDRFVLPASLKVILLHGEFNQDKLIHLRKTHPQLGIWNSKESPNRQATLKSRDIDHEPLDSNTANLNNENLTANQIFRSKARKKSAETKPHPSNYRLNIHNDLIVHKDKVQTLNQDKPLQLIHNINTQETIENIKAQEASDLHLFLGCITLDANSSQWIALPSLTPIDKLIHIHTNPKIELDIAYCADKSLFYVKPKDKITTHITLSFTIKANLVERKLHQNQVDPSIVKLISKLKFNATGELEDNSAKRKFCEYTLDEQLAALINYFNAFEVKSLSYQGNNQIDLLNAIIHEQAGVCRQRTIALMALAKALHIPARAVHNDIHSFVEVEKKEGWLTADLGGGPSNLTIKPLPPETIHRPIKNEHAKEHAKEHAHAPLTVDNQFRTWDSAHIHAETMQEYVIALIQHADPLKPGSKNILSVLNREQIQALSTEFLNQKKSACFYLPDLNHVTDKARPINNESGEPYTDESMLKKFLTHAKPGDVLLVNWSDYEAKFVGYNSMMEHPRMIKGMLIPEEVIVVGLLDKNQIMNEDFYSRFRIISDAPAKLTIKPFLPEPNQILNTSSENLIPIHFYDDSWRSTLLGQIHALDGKFQFVESDFVNALKAGKTSFVFKNAPWHLPEFKLFMTELLTKRIIQVNGQTYDIPDGFKCARDDTPYLLRYDQLYILDYPCTMPPDSYVLNSMSFSTLFKRYKSKKGNLNTLKGIIAEYEEKKLTLFVTETFSHSQWAQILDAAKRTTLQLILAPGVRLPNEMMEYGEKIQMHHVNISPYATIVETNDVDFVTQIIPDECTIIPVNEHTTHADLIGSNYILSHQPLKFEYKLGSLTEALTKDQRVILRGQLSPQLAKELESLFLKQPYIKYNGENTPIIKGKLTIITDKNPGFNFVTHEKMYFDPAEYWEELATQFDIQNTNRLKQACTFLANHYTFSYIELKSMMKYMALRPDRNPLKSILRMKHNYATNKQIIEKAWTSHSPRKMIKTPSTHGVEQKRKNALEETLKNNWYVFVAGPSGVGKSTTINKLLKEMDFSVVSVEGSIEEKLLDWVTPSNKKNAVFLDEANLFSAGAFDLLEGLYEVPPRIIIKGKAYDVPPDNRIIFAGNFTHFAGRQQLNFIARHGNVITFKELTDDFLRNNIIRVVAVGLKITEEAQIKEMTDIFLNVYHYINSQLLDKHPLTARNLQMMVMRYTELKKQLPDDKTAMMVAAYDEVSAVCDRSQYKQLYYWIKNNYQIDVSELKKSLKEHIKTQGSLKKISAIKTRVNPIRVLNQLMEIRNRKIEMSSLAQSGSNGLLFEGSPGIGKSYLAMEYLLAQGFVDGDKVTRENSATPSKRFYHLRTTDPDEIKAKLFKAFHEGAIVIIDELNTLSIEHTLNALLSGKTPEGSDATHPGFFVIATQNPISFGKRKALSDAFLNRFHKLNLKDYNKDDLILITSILANSEVPNQHIAEKLVTAFLAAQSFARSRQIGREPTPRDLFEAARATNPITLK